MTTSVMNYEQHVQQNNERLLCIKQALQDQSTFVSAAKELLEWCLDPRAFQKPFEDNIVACLNTVSHVAKRDGFDLNLGCRLLSICSNYRDKFSPHHSVLLEQWSEDLSQAVLLRHQSEASTSGTSNHNGNMDTAKIMQKQQASMMGATQQDMMWSGGPGGSVSVVTTVYSGVSGYGANPQHQSYSTAGSYGGGHSNYLHTVPSSSSVQKPSMYPVDNSYGSYNNNHQDYKDYNNIQQSHMTAGDYNSTAPHAALNAAQVAAAAVATATATATAVALDQSQFQSYHGPPSQNAAYNSHQYAGPIGVVHNQYANAPRMLHPNSIGRPLVPPSYVLQGARGRASVGGGMRYPMNGQKMLTPNAVVAQPQYVGGPGTSQPMIGPRNGVGASQGVMQRPNAPPHLYQKYVNVAPRSQYAMPTGCVPAQQSGAYFNDGYSNVTNLPLNPGTGHVAGYQPRMYANNSQFGNMATGVCSNSSVASSVHIASPPRYSSSVPATQMPVDVRPNVKRYEKSEIQEDDSRPTFPVINGVIMNPFRLEHNSPVSQLGFVISEQTYNMLYYSTDFDLQLKCFHQDDKTAVCHWPNNASVQICINGTPVMLKDPKKPLYIKRFCHMNQNVLQISVQQCSCSHLFVLALVKRCRLLSRDLAKDKIKRYFQNSDVITVDGQKGGTQQMPINVPLKCPLSMRRIEFPARGMHCKHIQCFDLETLINMPKNKDRNNWPCPICEDELNPDTLEIDQFILDIINADPSDLVDDVSIDSNASWKPTSRNSNQDNSDFMKVKDEPNGSVCPSVKRFKAEPGLCPPYQWASTPNGYSAGSPLSSPPSYYQPDSPLPLSSQRQRNNTQPLHPATVNTNYGAVSARSSRQSMDSVLSQEATASNGSGGFPQMLPGHPKSVGAIATCESVMPTGLQHQNSVQQQQSESNFAGSAPYTPASNLSSGSQNGGPSSIATNGDGYGNDLYSDLDFLLNDSTTTNSMSLLGDCMDELDMLKYLGNSDGESGAGEQNKSLQNSATKSSSSLNANFQHTANANSCRSTSASNAASLCGNLNGSNGNANFVSSSELSALDDVLSNYFD